VIEDIASGLNENRKGLNKLFKLVTERQIEAVFITYKDRLTRFSFKYLEAFSSSYGCRIEAIDSEEVKEPQQELVEAIVTSFAGRIYGAEAIKREESWRLLKVSLETVKLTASFKLDASVPESLFSTYREFLGQLLDHAWAEGVTSFKRLKAEKYHELRAGYQAFHHTTSIQPARWLAQPTRASESLGGEAWRKQRSQSLRSKL